jgi:hypothetical protein
MILASFASLTQTRKDIRLQPHNFTINRTLRDEGAHRRLFQRSLTTYPNQSQGMGAL